MELPKKLTQLAAICAVFFATAGLALAGERQFAADNCAITFPDTWHVMTNMPPQQGMLVAYSDAPGKRIVFLEAINKKPVAPLDDLFIAAFDKGVQESGGGERLSGKYIEVAGIKSYERVGVLNSSGKKISTFSRLVPGEDKYFDIWAMRFDGEATNDPQILQVVTSFRFLHPFVPSYTSDSAAYQFGKTIGRLSMIIVLAAIVVYAIRSNRTARSTPRPPSGPPPIRPGQA